MNDMSLSAGIEVEDLVGRATQALLDQQRPDGHWVFELEADATIPSEYVLLVHYLAETPNLELERKIGIYLRRIQGEDGGWPLYHAGATDISATVKAYFALKMIGDPVQAPHMVRAREAILARGGAGRTNVFTRILLALYGETSWNNGADRSRGTDPCAALVSDPSVENVLLGAHGDRAASRACRAEAGRAQSARRACAGTVRRRRRSTASARTASEPLLVCVLPRSRCGAQTFRSVLAKGLAQARDRSLRRVRHRAAERRRRIGRHLSRPWPTA